MVKSAYEDVSFAPEVLWTKLYAHECFGFNAGQCAFSLTGTDRANGQRTFFASAAIYRTVDDARRDAEDLMKRQAAKHGAWLAEQPDEVRLGCT